MFAATSQPLPDCLCIDARHVHHALSLPTLALQLPDTLGLLQHTPSFLFTCLVCYLASSFPVPQQPYMQDFWEVTKAACEQLLLSYAQPPPCKPFDQVLLQCCCPMQHLCLVSVSATTYKAEIWELWRVRLGGEAASPDFAEAVQPWQTFSHWTCHMPA